MTTARPTACAHCGISIAQTGRGRPRIYCTDDHRTAHHRAQRRRAAPAIPTGVEATARAILAFMPPVAVTAGTITSRIPASLRDRVPDALNILMYTGNIEDNRLTALGYEREHTLYIINPAVPSTAFLAVL